ncbi:MAG: hypothetical protein ACP5I4_08780 [Oceanipulchritudo sp.]
MNKSLLIIICDFLLISILALVEFKPEVEQAMVNEQQLRNQAAEEMLELLQLSLEHENAQREEVESSLRETSAELRETRESLENTEETLGSVRQDLDSTRQEKEALASSLMETRSSLQLTREEKTALQESLAETEQRTRQLQQELRDQRNLAAQKAEALQQAEDNLARLESQQQRMATQLQIRETEKKMLEQNLVTARAEMEKARIEAERARVRSESLAAEVGELAESSTALKEEFRQAQALSMNTIYKRFEENRVFIHFEWAERGLFTNIPKEAALQSLLLETDVGVFAVFATTNTPLQENSRINPSATMKIGDRSFRIREIGFLEEDPSIAAVRIPREVAESSGLSPFRVSSDPFRFSTAVLVSDDRELYGEIPIRIPPGEPGSLEVQTRLFNRLFGEFSPGPGDYVFSMTGELIGIMVRPTRARLIKEPEISEYRTLGEQ